MSWRSVSASVVVGTITLLRSVGIAEAADVSLDSAVKATFLYKFIPFVTWPDSAFATAESPLVICVLGDEALAESLKTAVAGQRNGTHPIAVRAVDHAAGDCRVLYIPEADAGAVASTTGNLKGRPVLTVTDLPIESAGHGMIDFVIDHGHVRFDIDNVAAAESGLAISSKLLALAHVVKTKGAAQ